MERMDLFSQSKILVLNKRQYNISKSMVLLIPVPDKSGGAGDMQLWSFKAG